MDEAGFTAARYLKFTSEAQDLAAADFIIVAVPTPIDSANQPDLHPLTSATRTAGANMKKGATLPPFLALTSYLWRYTLVVRLREDCLNSKDIIKMIEADGWQLIRAKGSHHHFKHPVKNGLVTIPHPKRTLPKGTVVIILQQAGLK